ncbi:hypothetical protein [Flavobacterium piscis]|uniref:Uncharacterized protein n=1 Tax=Flavobacterium piscis TaxID=1114874 RepID=A0ABU1YB57_9FLAO|nr:hypothetical protein [Flavobacterium piscis]MDR7211477.1 hypothetical protein [Flavobacterium piscis]
MKIFKKIPTLIFIFMNFNGFAQSEYEGLYSIKGAKAYLFQEGGFVAIGYGSVVIGNWEKEGDTLVLKPKKTKFLLFGKHTPGLEAETTRIEFRNFTNDRSFFGTNPTDCALVFGLESDCEPDKSYSKILSIKAKTILLGNRHTYTFQTNAYNDFITIYFPNRDYDKDYYINISPDNYNPEEVPKLSDLSEEEQSALLAYKEMMETREVHKYWGVSPEYNYIDAEVTPNEFVLSTTNPHFVIKCEQ